MTLSGRVFYDFIIIIRYVKPSEFSTFDPKTNQCSLNTPKNSDIM